MRKSTSKTNTKKVVESTKTEVQNLKDVVDMNESVSDNKANEAADKLNEVSEVYTTETENTKNDPKEEISTWNKKFKYQMLDHMRQDCDYYLNGHEYAQNLWTGNEEKQIEYMLLVWDSFDDRDKPRWLSREQIIEYAKQMGVEI